MTMLQERQKKIEQMNMKKLEYSLLVLSLGIHRKIMK